MNIYVVVVTTFCPVFLAINEYRRKQCKKYNIPVLFVYNGKVPEGYELKSDERTMPLQYHAPAMFQKLKYAIQEIYNDLGVDPDYIVRLNSRTFMNFKNLNFFLSHVGKEKVAAGPFILNDEQLYLQGTCMIFSKDVALQFANDDDNVKDTVLWHSDDCTISSTVENYANFYDMNFFYENTGKLVFDTLPTTLPDFIEKPILFRIRNGIPNASPYGTPLTLEEEIDIQCWKLLLQKYDDIEV